MIVFAGPSLCGADGSQGIGIELRPPVRQGDVYLATLEGPTAIGIIDGYFDGMPSVWHKEILWAMSQGIAVLGASSMGALRAAELDTFGMIGIGSIYADYRDGSLEDDDEVALTHGPAELGFAPLSVAMVNVRATLRAASGEGILSTDEAELLIDRAKIIFFKDRSWDSILLGSELANCRPGYCADLLSWIASNEVDQKNSDARLLLDVLVAGQFEKPDADFHFEQTDLWVHTTRTWKSRQKRNSTSERGAYNLLGSNNFLS